MSKAATKIETAQVASNDIATIVAQNPVIVLVDKQKRVDLYAHIQREIDAFVPDATTPKGREAIKALAYKIVRTKTAIDGAGKTLNEEARTRINVVDEARRDARNTLDMMAEAVRKPVTDWEDSEAKRVASCEAIIASLMTSAVIMAHETVDDIKSRGTHVVNTAIDPERFGDLYEKATDAKAQAITMLREGLTRLIKEEADRAELENLRAEAADRDRIEAEKAAAEAERERIAAAEQAAKERDERIAREATEKAQREADARHAAELQAERDRSAEIERKAQAERNQAAALKAEADRAAAAEKAKAEKQAAEDKAREENKAHQKRVIGAAKAAIMGLGVSEAHALAVVEAIIAGDVPAVTLRF